MVMAPDQESSSDHQVKPLDDICNLNNTLLKNDSFGNNNCGVSIINNNKADDKGGGCVHENGKSSDINHIEIAPSTKLNPRVEVRLDWHQIKRVGAGLANLGNSCFLNTVIQCLTYCPPLANYLLQNDHCSICKSFEFCMMCELQKHIRQALERSGDVIEPVDIYKNLKSIAEHFQTGQQEDAHEFLRFVIENLWQASISSTEEHLNSLKESTIINQIFGGYHRSQVICLRCKKKSNTYEPFMDFILDIKHNANTLEKALEQFVKPELLEKDNAYSCPHCKTLVSAEKTYTIHRAPNVATFQLKRFDYYKSHGGKVTKHVSYPEHLDLHPYMSEQTDNSLLYSLNAVLVHIGQNCNSGHYFCYIRNSNGSWYLMDDAKVQRVSLNDVLNQQAYVLFYVRQPIPKTCNSQNKVPNGTHLRNGRIDTSDKVSNNVDDLKRLKSYTPFTRWVNCGQNFWSSQRKQEHVEHRQGSASTSSIDDERASRSSRDSSSSYRGCSEKSGSSHESYHGDKNRESPKHRFSNPSSFHSKSNWYRTYSDNSRYRDDSYNSFGRRPNYSRTYRENAYQPRFYSRMNSDTHLYERNGYHSMPAYEYRRPAPYDVHNNPRSYYSPRSSSFYSDDPYYDNSWSPHQYSNNGKYHYYSQDKPASRKFHAKSKSADFISFSRLRYYPYNNQRRQGNLQQCY